MPALGSATTCWQRPWGSQGPVRRAARSALEGACATSPCSGPSGFHRLAWREPAADRGLRRDCSAGRAPARHAGLAMASRDGSRRPIRNHYSDTVHAFISPGGRFPIDW